MNCFPAAERELQKRGNTWDLYGSGMWVNFGLDADTSGKEEGRLAQKKLAKGKE